MLKSILQYTNTRLLTTGYFKSLYELVELKPQKDNGSAPMVYCTNGEFKDIDTDKDLCYTRITRPISISLNTNTIRSGETLLNINFALRVVGIVKKVETDDSYKHIGLASDISRVIADNTASLTTLLSARSVSIVPSSMIVNTEEVYRAEFPNTRKEDIRYNYTMAAVDFNVVVVITSDCWERTCGDTITDCQTLLAALTKSEKNECILPSYNFADTEVTDNLTAQQITDLTNFLNP